MKILFVRCIRGIIAQTVNEFPHSGHLLSQRIVELASKTAAVSFVNLVKQLREIRKTIIITKAAAGDCISSTEAISFVK